MTRDFELYESFYDYLLHENKQYVDLLRLGVSHQRMIDEKLLGNMFSAKELQEAEKEHVSRMSNLRRVGLMCQVCEGKPCNIEDVAERLISQLEYKDGSADDYDTSTKAGYLQQRASNRHTLTNYDVVIHTLPICCLATDETGGHCSAHFLAYSSIKRAATF